MSDIVRTLEPGDVLLGVWCHECKRPFQVGERVLIEHGRPARHDDCARQPAERL
jgi:hypothetical protein